jgi:hypothetical protein
MGVTKFVFITWVDASELAMWVREVCTSSNVSNMTTESTSWRRLAASRRHIRLFRSSRHEYGAWSIRHKHTRTPGIPRGSQQILSYSTTNRYLREVCSTWGKSAPFCVELYWICLPGRNIT